MINKSRRIPTPEILWFRHHAKNAIRNLLDRQGFIELDTPYLLRANTPDPHIDPIIAHVKSGGGQTFQLHTSPEIWLKKGLELGFNKLYQMGRVFRDDPPGPSHSREFTMLEWYRTDADLNDLLIDCEIIFKQTHEIAIERKLIAKTPAPKFIKIDLDSLFKELAGIDLPSITNKITQGDRDVLQRTITSKGDYLPKNASFSDAFFHVMLKYIEPNLDHAYPTVITRWPIQLAALAASCPDNPSYCDRFEIYFRGLEIANAYQECIDSAVLRARFVAENNDRQLLNKPTFPIDESFLQSVEKMRKTAGIAMGIDRLLMATIKKSDIGEIIWGQVIAD